MPNEPLVCAVMLTRDRPEMARKAVACFRAQTYPAKQLLVYDTAYNEKHEYGYDEDVLHLAVRDDGLSIGALRNQAMQTGLAHYSLSGDQAPKIFIHWDDDDYSHPNRIAEQVEFLKLSKADAVGYNSMLFWRTPPGQAWLYDQHPRPDYIIGTSLCYWRKTWERKPFKDLPKTKGSSGEDSDFIQGLRCAAVTSFGAPIEKRSEVVPPAQDGYDPRMIARIHGGNTSVYNLEEMIERGSRQWHRVPQCDAMVRGIMEGQ